MNRSQLAAHLAAAGLQCVTLKNYDGAAVLVTPHGARVLGLFPQPTADNLYFVNPELSDPAAAKKFLAGEHVLGGDRCWIAPESGLFFKGNSLADGVVTQPGIDPGHWAIADQTASSIRFVNDFSATYFHAPRTPVRGIVERSIRLLKNPFTHAPDRFPKDVAYAGYEIASSFRLLQSPVDDLHFGLWFLIQLVVPQGGYLYVPTAAAAVVTGDYYEPTGPDYLRITAPPHAHVRFKLDSIDRHKIGIRATEVSGRAAFLSNAFPNGQGTLLVRNFLNNPSARYADVPLHTPQGTQDSVQSYNHNTGPGGFGELEFHTPGISRAMPEPVVTDTNHLWSFTGPRAALVKVAAFLLNLPETVFAV